MDGDNQYMRGCDVFLRKTLWEIKKWPKKSTQFYNEFSIKKGFYFKTPTIKSFYSKTCFEREKNTIVKLIDYLFSQNLKCKSIKYVL